MDLSKSQPMRRLPLLITLVAAACGGTPDAKAPPRTKEQQRAADSTIGASALPGARGVQSAMKAADSAAARNRALDSIANSP